MGQLRVVALQRPAECRAQVVVIDGHPVEPWQLMAARHVPGRFLRQGQVGTGVPIPGLRRLVAFGESPGAEALDRLEQPVAGQVGTGDRLDEALLDEDGKRIDRLGAKFGRRPADGVELREPEPAGEHGQSFEQPPCRLVEQRVAPCDGVGERSLASGQVAGRDAGEVQSPGELVRDRGRREQSDPRGCELDPERQPVEVVADLGHGAAVLVRQPEGWVGTPGTLDEEADGVGRVELADRELLLQPDSQRCPTRHDKAHVGTGALEERVDPAAAGIRCSKLSSTSRIDRPARNAWSRSMGVVCGDSTRLQVPAIASRTSSGSSIPSRRTSQAPSAKDDARRRAVSMARRVLPAPPGPVSVTSADSASRRSSISSSRSRPTKLVSRFGRFPAGLVGSGERREVRGQALDHELVEWLGAIQVAQSMRPERTHRDAGGEVVGRQRTGRIRQQDLAAMTEAAMRAARLTSSPT